MPIDFNKDGKSLDQQVAKSLLIFFNYFYIIVIVIYIDNQC